jgi:type IV pilus assembly protein PilX
MSAAFNAVRTSVPRSQRGAILVVSLLLLLVLTVLAVATMRMSTSEERMAGNVRDTNLSFQAAEAAARAAEARILRTNLPPIQCTVLPCQLPQDVMQQNSIGDVRNHPAFWPAAATEFGVAAVRDVQGTAQDPQYAAEYLSFVPDDLSTGSESLAAEGRTVYRVVARSGGGSGLAETVLETTVARR